MKGSVSRRKPSLALNVVAVVVAINVAGAAVYVLTRHKAQESANSGDTPAREGEPTGDVSRALRAAGLAALESGRYEEAVKRFTEAAKSSKASADLPQLMKIAMELRDRSSTVPQARTTTTTDTVATADGKPEEPKAVADEPEDKVDDRPTAAATAREDKAAKARREREQAARERERERERDKARRAAAVASARTSSKPEPADVDSTPATSSPGTIIVSSTPSGLTVQLDGRILDQTPLRLTAEPGSHEIALLHNSTVVFSRRLNVVSSSVQSLDPDVSAQVALLTPSRAEPQPTMASAQTGGAAAAKEPASAGLNTPKSDDKPAGERGNTGDTSEKPRQDLDPNALYAIANSSVGLSSVSAEQLADVYFGRSQTLNGRKVEPILRSPSGGAGGAFFRSVLHTTTRSYRESWQKLELAGKATPPPILSNASDVWRAVSSRSGAISFALGSELNGNATNLRPIRISY